MATLYFSSATYEWFDNTSWYTDSGLTTPAGTTPTSSDDVYLYSPCLYYSSGIFGTPSVNSLVVETYELAIPINVTTTATFNNSSYYTTYNLIADTINFYSTAYNQGILYPTTVANFYNSSANGNGSGSFAYINGSAHFYDTSTNASNGWIQPPIPSTVTFDGLGSFYSSSNQGIISGDVTTLTFNSESYSIGTGGGGGTINITGDIILNDTSNIRGGSVNAATITCNGSSYMSYNPATSSSLTVNGQVTFNDGSVHGYPPESLSDYTTINGTTIFNNYSLNKAAITGETTFNNNSINWGLITGNATFNDDTFSGSYTSAFPLSFGTEIRGTAIFNNNSYNNCYIDNAYYGGTPVVFNDNSSHGNSSFGYNGTINGGATFNNNAQNNALIVGNVTFNNSSFNASPGTLSSSATFNDTSFNLGTVAMYGNTWNGLTGINTYGRFTGGESNIYQTGTLYYNAAVSNSWDDANNWWVDSSHTSQAPSYPIVGDSVILSNYVNANMSGTPSVNNLTANGSWISPFGINIIITGLGTFNNVQIGDSMSPITITGNILLTSGSVLNSSTVTGNATFINGATNQNGTVTGSAIFDLVSAEVMIFSGYNGTYGGSGSVQFKYDKGVNGSSILGIV